MGDYISYKLAGAATIWTSECLFCGRERERERERERKKDGELESSFILWFNLSPGSMVPSGMLHVFPQQTQQALTRTSLHLTSQ